MATKSMDLGQVMGTSAYQEAQAGGYTGTREEFQKELAAVGNGGETFVIQAEETVLTSGITISNVDKTLDEVNAARQEGKAIRLKLIIDSGAYQEFPLLSFLKVSEKFIYTFGGADSSDAASVQLTFEGDSVSAVAVDKKIIDLSNTAPAASGNASAGTSDAAARADHVHPKEVSATDRATWNGKADLVDGKVPTSQLPDISSVKTYTATISTTWTEDSNTGVKTQNVAISGVRASHTAKVDHAYTGSGTSEDYAAFVEAENQYLTYITNGYAETYDGGIKFTIFGDANTVSIPIVVEVA